MTTSLGSLLVVDDEEMNRDMLSRRLEAEGYSVRTAIAATEEARRYNQCFMSILKGIPPINESTGQG